MRVTLWRYPFEFQSYQGVEIKKNLLKISDLVYLHFLQSFDQSILL